MIHNFREYIVQLNVDFAGNALGHPPFLAAFLPAKHYAMRSEAGLRVAAPLLIDPVRALLAILPDAEVRNYDWVTVSEVSAPAAWFG